MESAYHRRRQGSADVAARRRRTRRLLRRSDGVLSQPPGFVATEPCPAERRGSRLAGASFLLHFVANARPRMKPDLTSGSRGLGLARHRWRGARPLSALACVAAWMGCEAHAPPPALTQGHSPAGSSTSRTSAASPGPPLSLGRYGRYPLGEPIQVALPFSVEAVQGGRSLLFVSQFAGERLGFYRRLDATTLALGDPQRIVDRHVVGAVDWSDGTWSLVSSDGANLCLTSSLHPDDRDCAAVAPQAMVAFDNRLALVELQQERHVARAPVPRLPPVARLPRQVAEA